LGYILQNFRQTTRRTHTEIQNVFNKEGQVFLFVRGTSK